MEAELNDQGLCWPSHAHKDRQFHTTEGLTAGPGTFKPWMEPKGGDVSECQTHTMQ